MLVCGAASWLYIEQALVGVLYKQSIAAHFALHQKQPRRAERHSGTSSGRLEILQITLSFRYRISSTTTHEDLPTIKPSSPRVLPFRLTALARKDPCLRNQATASHNTQAATIPTVTGREPYMCTKRNLPGSLEGKLCHW